MKYTSLMVRMKKKRFVCVSLKCTTGQKRNADTVACIPFPSNHYKKFPQMSSYQRMLVHRKWPLLWAGSQRGSNREIGHHQQDQQHKNVSPFTVFIQHFLFLLWIHLYKNTVSSSKYMAFKMYSVIYLLRLSIIVAFIYRRLPVDQES